MKKIKPPYKCWVCKEEFWRFPVFKNHIRTVHQGKPIQRMSYEDEIKSSNKDKDKT